MRRFTALNVQATGSMVNTGIAFPATLRRDYDALGLQAPGDWSPSRRSRKIDPTIGVAKPSMVA